MHMVKSKRNSLTNARIMTCWISTTVDQRSFRGLPSRFHLNSPSTVAYSFDLTTMPDLLATDGLTVVLGLAAAGAFLLHSFFTPQSLVHPILLGRQSDVDRVRTSGESAVYRNYGTGLMARASRPFLSIRVRITDCGWYE